MGGDWLTAEVNSRYGDCLRRAGQFDKARPILETAASDIQKAVGVPNWGLPTARNRVADLYLAEGKPAEEAKWREKLKP